MRETGRSLAFGCPLALVPVGWRLGASELKRDGCDLRRMCWGRVDNRQHKDKSEAGRQLALAITQARVCGAKL